MENISKERFPLPPLFFQRFVLSAAHCFCVERWGANCSWNDQVQLNSDQTKAKGFALILADKRWQRAICQEVISNGEEAVANLGDDKEVFIIIAI